MAKKVTYERWINLFLPDGWNEREEMGFVLIEKDNWPGMIQLSFMEREETKTPPAEAARKNEAGNGSEQRSSQRERRWERRVFSKTCGRQPYGEALEGAREHDSRCTRCGAPVA